ncbi:hypothetical protein EDC01DRAFT_641973 [Geopyxis carbonaria]|nr:hypothetical protein EDC01DRAFT_641973 [Geopyxis carbonaria]
MISAPLHVSAPPPAAASALVPLSTLSTILSSTLHLQLTTARLLLSQLIRTISLLFTVANIVRYLTYLTYQATQFVSYKTFRLVHYLSRQALWMLRARKRWQRLNEALFREFAMLVMQPNPLLLVLLWPGWWVIGGLWWVGAMKVPI